MAASKKAKFDSLQLGIAPPQSIEAEKHILGVVLNYPTEFLSDVREILQPNDFYKEEHKIVYEVILELARDTVPDIVLVFQKLQSMQKSEDVGGIYYLQNLLNPQLSSAPIKKHCLIVKQNSIKRQLIKICGDGVNKSIAPDEDVFNVLDELKGALSMIDKELSALSVTPLQNIAANVIDKIAAKLYNFQNDIKDPNEVYTGMTEWDRINGSLFPALYVIAGRPAMGKGVHLTQLAVNMGSRFPIGIINGEMTNEQLLTRIGCNMLGIDNRLFKKMPHELTQQDVDLVQEAMGEAIGLDIRLYDQKRIDLIESKCETWVRHQGVKCILADFLTIFSVPPELEKYMTETQKTNYVLDKFVDLAKRLKVPIILYVQMNREILGRHGKKEPMLSDLKQSGKIEELAYQVSFLHRPEYYDPNDILDENGVNIKGLMYQIVAKHRDGELARIKHKAELSKSKLSDWTETPLINWNQLGEDTPF